MNGGWGKIGRRAALAGGVACGLLMAIVPLRGASILTNGNIEGGLVNGRLPGWLYTQNNGLALASAYETSVHGPTNSAAALLLENGATAVNAFSAASGSLAFSFDFSLSHPSNPAAWQVSLMGESSPFLTLQISPTVQLLGGGTASITRDTWYHVSISLDTSTGLFSGTLSNAGGTVSLGGGTALNAVASVSSISIQASAGSSWLYVDNFAINAAPEPPAWGLLGLAGLATLVRARKRTA